MPADTPRTEPPRAPGNGDSVVISVDAMGGDRGPSAVVDGMARSAQKNPEIRFIVHGPRDELLRLIARRRILADRCDIRDTSGVVSMSDKPAQVIRNAQGTSCLLYTSPSPRD